MNGSSSALTNSRDDLWSQEDIDFLIENRFNYSLSELGAKLGKSRSAIAGKSRRLGLRTTKTHHSRMVTRGLVKAWGNGTYEKREKPAATTFKPIVSKFKRGERADPQHMSEPSVVILDGVGVKIGDIEAHHCKWVVGEPSEFTCCGQRRREGSPYCENHHQIAYKPVKGAKNG